MSILEIIFILCYPALVLYLCKKSAVLKNIGPVVICYISGFVLAVTAIPYDKALSQDVASMIVIIAIPLILFGFDLKSARKLTPAVTAGFGMQIITVLIVCYLVGQFADNIGIQYAPQLAGMATGLYTGGTPNMVAIGNAFITGKDAANVITAANTADFFVGGIYFLLILVIMKPVYIKMLGESTDLLIEDDNETDSNSNQEIAEEYDLRQIVGDKKHTFKLLGVILLAIAVVALGIVIEYLIHGNLDSSLFVTITVSVLGIAISFIKPVREVKGSYQVGQYLVLVFSLGLSMSIDLKALMSGLLPTILLFAVIQTLIIVGHMLLCGLCGIDAATSLITNVAGLYGPPFIAPVAESYGKKELILPGVICGVIGLVLGNQFGIIMTMILNFKM